MTAPEPFRRGLNVAANYSGLSPNANQPTYGDNEHVNMIVYTADRNRCSTVLSNHAADIGVQVGQNV